MSRPTESAEVRQALVRALRLDLIGPWAGHALAGERLRGWERPSNWYLTGFLVPRGAPIDQRGDADADDELDVAERAGLGEDSTEDRAGRSWWKAHERLRPRRSGEPAERARTGIPRSGEQSQICPQGSFAAWIQAGRR